MFSRGPRGATAFFSNRTPRPAALVIHGGARTGRSLLRRARQPSAHGAPAPVMVAEADLADEVAVPETCRLFVLRDPRDQFASILSLADPLPILAGTAAALARLVSAGQPAPRGAACPPDLLRDLAAAGAGAEVAARLADFYEAHFLLWLLGLAHYTARADIVLDAALVGKSDAARRHVGDQLAARGWVIGLDGFICLSYRSAVLTLPDGGQASLSGRTMGEREAEVLRRVLAQPALPAGGTAAARHLQSLDTQHRHFLLPFLGHALQ